LSIAFKGLWNFENRPRRLWLFKTILGKFKIVVERALELFRKFSVIFRGFWHLLEVLNEIRNMAQQSLNRDFSV